ncbi:major facilitator super transporter protein [Dimargaris xerosporica]|nr:major facilitator super transporter protein [Dimargaris xerosporica]
MRNLVLSLGVVLALECVGLGLFSAGFFPYKRVLPGFADYTADTPDSALGSNGSARLTATYDRLVVMVVDALRYDFVFSRARSGMKFTQELIESGQALAYVAKATPPTVTMPCLKALTTGSTPNFLDAVLNIAEDDASATLATQDNLLWQLKHRGHKRLVFYGDDTWLRLFPGLFDRYEGASSFLVTDTVEVDRNVTRHIRPQLDRSDWEVLILHYLGLDHIGHLQGPESPLMQPKQREMDSAVATIYRQLARTGAQRLAKNATAKPTLFVLLGDHGMNELGNHGGTSAGEVSPAMVFMSPAFTPRMFSRSLAGSADVSEEMIAIDGTIQQIDLVPTLSVLFGIPIPQNSIGSLIAPLLSPLPLADQVAAFRRNADQIWHLAYSNYPNHAPLHDALDKWKSVNCSTVPESDHAIPWDRLHCYYTQAREFHRLVSDDVGHSDQWADQAMVHYQNFITQGSTALAKAFSSYHLPSMVGGLVVLGLALLGTGWILWCRSNSRNRSRLQVAWIGGFALTYVVAMFGSSFVEDEQYFWYFWLSTYLLTHAYEAVVQALMTGSHCRQRTAKSNTFGGGWMHLAAIVGQWVLWRIAQQWNHAGMRAATTTEIRHYLSGPYKANAWVVFAITLVYIVYQQWRLSPFGSMKLKKPSAVVQWQRSVLGIMVLLMAIATGIYHWSLTTPAISSWVRWVDAWVTNHPDTNGLPQVLPWLNYGLFGCTVTVTVGCVVTLKGSMSKIAFPQSLALLSFYTSTILNSLSIVLVLLNRVHNAGLFVVFHGITALNRLTMVKTVSDDATQPVRRGGSCWWFGHLCMAMASFYCFGYSNALSTVDLGSAYTGVSAYRVGLVGVLTFVSNWAGPIFWSVATGMEMLEWVLAEFMHDDGPGHTLHETAKANPDCRGHHPCTCLMSAADRPLNAPTMQALRQHLHRLLGNTLAQLIFSQLFGITVLSLVVFIQRRHLFIWSVFSPKYLYQLVWALAFLVMVHGGTIAAFGFLYSWLLQSS